MKWRLFLALLLLGLALTGCRSQFTPTPYVDFNTPASPEATATPPAAQRPLLIAFASVLSPHETIGQYRKIADYVSKQMGRPAVLIQRKTYAEVNMLLSNGEVDLAFLSTGAYSSYRGMNEIELFVMAEHGGNCLYTADVIVHKDSPIKTMDDLQGKVFAFTDPLSYSGHMVMEDYLRQRHTVPELYFKRYFFTYSHDKSLWAVANKIADAASFDSQIYEYAREKTPELAAQVRIITSMGPAPTGPVVISKRLSEPEKEQLRTIFLNMHTSPEMNDTLQSLVIDRFVLPTPQLYEPLRTLYDRTSILL